jgi:metal-responsive CopG/Arc/MetJ family transcriptional regulator
VEKVEQGIMTLRVSSLNILREFLFLFERGEERGRSSRSQNIKQVVQSNLADRKTTELKKALPLQHLIG